ncbi:hypothetical protein BSKO_04043 [Bryopsis sp. KO-2023]|nr:hypothetical protein BSKO_04043 [Bryopsis sp. KO-2023]
MFGRVVQGKPATAGGDRLAPVVLTRTPQRLNQSCQQIQKTNGKSMFRCHAAVPKDEKVITKAEEDISELYTKEMQQKMNSKVVMEYNHEEGMNYAKILDDVIVGSCLQTPEDVDKLAEIGVTTVLNLQENSNLEYFDLDIKPIQQRCEERGDINLVRCPVRDFDPVDLRLRLPKVVALLVQEHDPEEGIVYIHCTAGLGRAPAVALAYMYWCRRFSLDGANARLQKVRPCGPKLQAIREATCDILYGSFASEVTLSFNYPQASTVELAGLDVGWGQKIALSHDNGNGTFTATRTLMPGKYSFKPVVDGEWVCSNEYPKREDGGNVNNFLEVQHSTRDAYVDSALHRLQTESSPLTLEESWRVLAALKRLQPCSEECMFEW